MKRKRHPFAGFSLVEVVVAMGITVFCLVALTGMLTVGLNTNHTASSQTVASSILSAVISDLRATPVTTPPGLAVTSPNFAISIPANPVAASSVSTLYFSPDIQSSTSASSTYIYRLTITFLPNGVARTATFVDLTISWPAQASPPNALGTAETFVALDRN